MVVHVPGTYLRGLSDFRFTIFPALICWTFNSNGHVFHHIPGTYLLGFHDVTSGHVTSGHITSGHNPCWMSAILINGPSSESYKTTVHKYTGIHLHTFANNIHNRTLMHYKIVVYKVLTIKHE